MTGLSEISAARRREVVDALRRGTVPQAGLDLFAVGLDRFTGALDDDIATVSGGGAAFHAVRGEYGSGKTFFARWLAERAKRAGLATTEVQVSETETPLHRLETVYRRLTERLATATHQPSALRAVVDSWFYTLEEEILDAGDIADDDEKALAEAVDALMEQRLADVARTTPAFAAALRGYRHARASGDAATAEALIAWLGGQKSVAASARRAAGVRGDLDHFAALGFLQGLLTVLRDCGHPGLLVVLDEIETLQRVRGDVREKGLNALRQLLDEIDAGRFPGLFLVITGTPAFYDGQQGAQRLAPLAQRLATDFTTDPRFDSPRAVQLRLAGFDLVRLGELGRNVRDLYVGAARHPERIAAVVDDAYIAELATAVTGGLGGKVGVAPRLFLRKLVADVLDRVDEFEDFDPRRHYALTVSSAELNEVERNAAASNADDVELDLP
ncbi:BREX system ATP-binding protein BrxD [Streptomyces sp. S1A1-8]|uniref:BREX system ATP-binding protein BrxD n=1 Tax=unclassified Streptomyces TaxID=2593676 RepID=UPI00116293A5|nr:MULTISPECIES: BREX system ATP-binding protein BrxD [unclassified Streptomyces]QDN97716.1 BREX system ATP-binding protein BrxD [Streptomyces sp. RLB1-9]QDO19423.1 BREX system ATP-binding protein BrxD [Streptomyces sp. S1A1-8]QDO29549.1 BREX system ATP-binding protein BrxD [Streptomyces sp. S1A1-3]